MVSLASQSFALQNEVHRGSTQDTGLQGFCHKIEEVKSGPNERRQKSSLRSDASSPQVFDFVNWAFLRWSLQRRKQRAGHNGDYFHGVNRIH